MHDLCFSLGGVAKGQARSGQARQRAGRQSKGPPQRVVAATGGKRRIAARDTDKGHGNVRWRDRCSSLGHSLSFLTRDCRASTQEPCPLAPSARRTDSRKRTSSSASQPTDRPGSNERSSLSDDTRNEGQGTGGEEVDLPTRACSPALRSLGRPTGGRPAWLLVRSWGPNGRPTICVFCSARLNAWFPVSSAHLPYPNALAIHGTACSALHRRQVCCTYRDTSREGRIVDRGAERRCCSACLLAVGPVGWPTSSEIEPSAGGALGLGPFDRAGFALP
ncbi:uncharacterized protein PFL1_01572 [Pseudozyma flocculosa PF-1]|uniref:uncharacterized protein n=1 Tax=Pseudozyma flocculosa PF-1 TaxID=1277687 RepID=UPI00045609D1|nr:uncharacterized protein PFL1_01572 [Pseudozyma flocculosa PF-1]EPQ30671.1 hypothetical protein PFL1_01572 [Pseudozyma flocculosa PF-1]